MHTKRGNRGGRGRSDFQAHKGHLRARKLHPAAAKDGPCCGCPVESCQLEACKRSKALLKHPRAPDATRRRIGRHCLSGAPAQQTEKARSREKGGGVARVSGTLINVGECDQHIWTEPWQRWKQGGGRWSAEQAKFYAAGDITRPPGRIKTPANGQA
jgi:hypothetical protein